MVLYPLTLCAGTGETTGLLLSPSWSLCVCLSVCLCLCLTLSTPPLCMPLCLYHSLRHSGSIFYPEGKIPHLGSDVRDQRINSTGLRACFEWKLSGPNPLREGGSLHGHLAYWGSVHWGLETKHQQLPICLHFLDTPCPQRLCLRGVGARGRCADSWVPGSDIPLPLLAIPPYPHF